MKIFFKIYQAVKNKLSLLRFFTVLDSWKLLQPCEVLLLAHNNDRAFNINGKSYSQLIHTLRYFLEKKGFICGGISTLFDVKNYKHNYYEDKTINIVFLLNIIKAKLHSIFTKQTYSEIKINTEAKIWDKILKKAQPKVVIGIQPYDSLCVACHRLLIPIFDFQHGAITENGPNYGRELYLKKDLNRIPTGYLCWNTESADILNQWCKHRNIKVEILGNPWLYRFNSPDSADFLIKNSGENKIFNSNKKIILITLQWGMDDIYPDFFNENDILHSALVETISRLNNEVLWLIRLHPVQIKSKKNLQKIKKLFKNNHSVDIDWSSHQPLPIVLALCHGHISWDSYTVVEAADMGVKSYVLNPGHFSTNRAMDNYQSNNEIKLPYIQQELDGLVRRSPSIPNSDDIVAWVKEIQSDNVQALNSKEYIFHLDKFYKIINELTESM